MLDFETHESLSREAISPTKILEFVIQMEKKLETNKELLKFNKCADC